MCDTCGCGATDVRVVDPGTGAVTHTHDGVTHTHEAASSSTPSSSRTAMTAVDVPHPRRARCAGGHRGRRAAPHSHGTTTVELELDVLGKNDALAHETRAWLAARDLVAVNLMSSPGSGKTTLLERTIRETAGRPSSWSRATRRSSWTPSASAPPAPARCRSTRCRLDLDAEIRARRWTR